MRKKIRALGMVGLMAASLAACSGTDSSSSSSASAAQESSAVGITEVTKGNLSDYGY